jgi:hypothetical protein
MILEDFVLLGRTVPEPNSNGRTFVCSAGVSAELRQLLRVYPLAIRGGPRRWGCYRVPVERNPADSRVESWKIKSALRTEDHDRVNEEFQRVAEIPRAARADLLRRFVVPSIAEADRQRLSLAIVEPDTIALDFEYNPESPDSPQLALFESDADKPRFGARRFPFIPRLRFADADGSHNLMLRDWGCYEFMRKRPGEHGQLGGALHIGSESSLLVGNMSHRRTAWLVISVLNGIREPPSLFAAAGVAEAPSG